MAYDIYGINLCFFLANSLFKIYSDIYTLNDNKATVSRHEEEKVLLTNKQKKGIHLAIHSLAGKE